MNCFNIKTDVFSCTVDFSMRNIYCSHLVKTHVIFKRFRSGAVKPNVSCQP